MLIYAGQPGVHLPFTYTGMQSRPGDSPVLIVQGPQDAIARELVATFGDDGRLYRVTTVSDFPVGGPYRVWFRFDNSQGQPPMFSAGGSFIVTTLPRSIPAP